MFPDGAVQQYAANIIAENLIGQVDDDGHRYLCLDQILDWRVDGSEEKEKGKKTTKGHQLHVAWRDGTESWIPLKDMKESYPIETAEFAVQSGIHELPAYQWWIPHAMRKKDQIISATVHRMVKKSFKYGHQVPSSVEEAYLLDKDSRNTRWKDAIAKELKNVRVVFKILDKEEELPPCLEYVPCHLVFDVVNGQEIIQVWTCIKSRAQ